VLVVVRLGVEVRRVPLNQVRGRAHPSVPVLEHPRSPRTLMLEAMKKVSVFLVFLVIVSSLRMLRSLLTADVRGLGARQPGTDAAGGKETRRSEDSGAGDDTTGTNDGGESDMSEGRRR